MLELYNNIFFQVITVNGWKKLWKIITKNVGFYIIMQRMSEMIGFNRFYKKEKTIVKTLNVDENLYNILEKLSKEVYDASINKLVIASIEVLINTEKIEIYKKENTSYVTRSFSIRENMLESLYEIKEKYNIPIYLLINIAIRNILIEEGFLKK